jgi:signal transduction histidine kinase/CheY-like chemotaxis protein
MTGWICVALLYSLAFNGYLYRYFLGAGGEPVLRAPSTLGTLATVLYTAVTVTFVGLGRIASWRRVYRTLAALLLLGTAWTLLGDYRAGAVYSNTVIAVFNVVWPVSMLDAWRRGLPNAKLFVLSFALVWPVQLVSLLVIHGFLNDEWLARLPFAWMLELAALFMMSVIVSQRSRAMYTAHIQAQQALLEARNQEQLKLEQAVIERTHALQTALIAADEANHAKTDFLARISHDLRTPLTSIIGFAELVQAAGHDNAERGRIIRRSARHMLAMVNDLIDYASGGEPDALQSAPVYLHALLDSIAQEGAELARRRGNRFTFSIERPLPPVLQLDAKGLRRVLGNLLDNAAKYTTDGTVELLVDCRRDAQPVQPGAPVDLTFVVRDTGLGIAPEDQQRIFEPFRRLDTAHTQPGIGLGLAIVSQWIARMGGSLDIDSERGAGTTIRVKLPALTAAEEWMSDHHVSDIAEVEPTIDGSGLRIWIAEDTADIRRLLADELSSLGFVVETAPDGAAIIERMVQAQGAAPDLLLTDYLMPGADGLAVLRAAREHLPGVPVVVLSAIPQATQDHEGNAPSGFDAILLKPVNFMELQNTLARLLKLDRIPSSAADAQAAPPLVSPPPQALAVAHMLIDLGAISDLIDWADAVASQYPGCEAFARKARQLATLGDLAELERLCG